MFERILTEISILSVGKFNRGVNICRKMKLQDVFDLTRLLELVDCLLTKLIWWYSILIKGKSRKTELYYRVLVNRLGIC